MRLSWQSRTSNHGKTTKTIVEHDDEENVNRKSTLVDIILNA